MAVLAADFLCQSSDRLPVSFNPISSPRAHHRSPQTPPCHDHLSQYSMAPTALQLIPTKRSTAGRRLVLDPSESDMVLTPTTIYHRDETIPPLPLTSLAPSTYPRVSNGHDRVLLYSPSFPSSEMAAPCERRRHRDAISRRI